MEGIVDDALRRGDHETLNNLPRIPDKLFSNPPVKLTPKSANNTEAPHRGASIVVYSYLKKPPFRRPV